MRIIRVIVLVTLIALSTTACWNIFENPLGLPSCSQLAAIDAAFWAKVNANEATAEDWNNYMTHVAPMKCIADAT